MVIALTVLNCKHLSTSLFPSVDEFFEDRKLNTHYLNFLQIPTLSTWQALKKCFWDNSTSIAWCQKSLDYFLNPEKVVRVEISEINLWKVEPF